ncbi:uncharacterized protein LOC131694316 [Topomyia yanbarensis]|uniref:uncharacterized protein LOC131694316 n=1 Tax=Topomyia yanbarensis TaxID=2498891 RepID=UPI00273CBB7D|nr:uncharacterized protein LOC131694316 [Topomyia yanbarensis]
MTTNSRSSSLFDCLLSPRLYGVLVGLMSLWAMLASISASVYLLMKYDDASELPESLKPYYQYATVYVVAVLIGIIIVVVYLFGIYKANEHCMMPFLVLLVADFLGYIASEVLLRAHKDKQPEQNQRWKKNLFDTAIFLCIFATVTYLYRIFKRKRHLKEHRLGGYQSISDSAENIAM